MKNLLHTQATAPGKLILSGEHAVVYGNPALVMAINRYVTTTVVFHSHSGINFSFPELKTECNMTLDALMKLQKRVKNNYQMFLKGNMQIKDVLQEPIELVQFALSLLLDSYQTPNIHIITQTNLFIGCGMGSSAAVIISILAAVAHHLQLTLTSELFFAIAHEAENMQHGKSSGLDLKSSLQGGCLYFKEGQVIPRTPSTLPFYIINTGKPDTTTGECVKTASRYFKNSSILQDFFAVTHAMDHALQSNHFNNIMYAIRENHQLLSSIGVVPEKVKSLINEIEQTGGAAKISGAGAVAGNNAGIILIATEDKAALERIASHHQHSLIPIQCETRGVHV